MDFIIWNQSYNDEPKPEYEPQINKASIVITAKPPTKPTSHKGILPVFAIKKAPIIIEYQLKK